MNPVGVHPPSKNPNSKAKIEIRAITPILQEAGQKPRRAVPVRKEQKRSHARKARGGRTREDVAPQILREEEEEWEKERGSQMAQCQRMGRVSLLRGAPP
ncbi:hypothetical protein BP6252_01489 [Coleophoma cylindrospora]|uniref:Uncharacterized protein n=1 Tax=Coleophoma cylindrospora TaxID=1849047 RepID=A0A3D8ST23_9HELO|nr:hypothetical protein BP6252_01489 [Coleophoma cylindrospora]